MKDLFTENYKKLRKAVKDDTNKWKDKLCSWIGIINVKMTIPPKAIYRFNASLSNCQWHFFTELEQIILKFLWKYKISQLAKKKKKIEEQSWRYHVPWFQIYHKTTISKIVWYWHKNRHIDQWVRIESSETNPLT